MRQGKRLLLIIAVVLFNLSAIDIVCASTIDISITNIGDAVLEQDIPFDGPSSTTWRSTANPNIASYYKSSGNYLLNTTYMEFSLAPLTGQTAVASANLYIYITDAWSNRVDNKAAQLKHAPNSSDATGVAATDQITGVQSVVDWTILGNQTTGWIGFDVTGFLNSDLNGGYNWSSWTMNNIDSLQEVSAGIEFYSGDGGNAPYLSVSLVPIPPTILLLGSGLIGIVGIRRKFKK